MASAPFPTTLSDLSFSSASNNTSIYSHLKSLRKSTLSIPNRLHSILSDSEFIVSVSNVFDPPLPLIANERCGSWYIPPSHKKGSAYFKSTDGHHGQWDFSLRRLNLNLLEILGQHGGAVVVDSTRRGKNLPDAFSKTVPIWVAVVNRTLFGEADDVMEKDERKEVWWWKLQRPPAPDQLGESEASQIAARIDGFVKKFEELGLDLDKLKKELRQPIKIVWAINGIFDPGRMQYARQHSQKDGDDHNCNLLVLCSASRRVHGAEMSDGGYIQGAGDDSEGWSTGLTSSLFWRHKDQLLATPEEDLPATIEGLLRDDRQQQMVGRDPVLVKPTESIFLAAGCSTVIDRFDLIVNCEGSNASPDPHILNLTCRSGKLGSRDLRDKLSEVKTAMIKMTEPKHDGKILIACSNGKDLSVGIALYLLCTFYDDLGRRRPGLSQENVDKQLVKRRLAWITNSKSDANPSRATLQAVNSFLMSRPD